MVLIVQSGCQKQRISRLKTLSDLSLSEINEIEIMKTYELFLFLPVFNEKQTLFFIMVFRNISNLFVRKIEGDFQLFSTVFYRKNPV